MHFNVPKMVLYTLQYIYNVLVALKYTGMSVNLHGCFYLYINVILSTVIVLSITL